MPWLMFSYKCEKCEQVWEEMVKSDEQDKVCCPQCGEKAEKVVGTAWKKMMKWSDWSVGHGDS